jgi:hypothetical protein
MGYYMNMRECEFHIAADKKDDALQAIKELSKDESRMSGGSFGNGGKKEAWYSWVTTSEFVDAKTLEDAIGAWRWEVETDEETGDITYIYFQGEKLGDDEVLFSALAPFITEGGYIEMSGEDGHLWRWAFTEGTLCEQVAEIIWS